jgi:hypothetical protein
VLFAASVAETVGRLVLVTPALSGPVPPDEARFWRTAGRWLLVAGPPVARVALRVAGRRLLDMKLRAYTDRGVRPAGRRPVPAVTRDGRADRPPAHHLPGHPNEATSTDPNPAALRCGGSSLVTRWAGAGSTRGVASRLA